MAHNNLIPGEQGVRLSTLSPKYLHTNSTSHTWPFSAMAELVDNAYDPDVEASQLWIDIKRYGSEYCLTFTDNGAGMNSLKLHKMLSFGFCEKVAKADHLPVGHYGNGFKSGSMRLGKDAIVFTKGEDRSQSVGFLSQTYLENINAQTILVPIVTWDSQGDVIERADGDKALQDILKYSLFKTKSQLQEQFKEIGSASGTRIIVSRMRKNQKGVSEFDLRTDTTDIRIPDDIESENNKYKRQERQNHIPESDYSLRAYCSILYLRPRMQIILRGKKVRTTVIAKSLSKTEVDSYRPNGVTRPIKVTFGFSQNRNHYGIMMYHRNRLIRPYVRVGYQQKANNLGVGVIGVIKCDYLQPTHNKQDFDYTNAHRSLMSALGTKLNDYWNEKKGKAQVNSNTVIPEPREVESVPDQLWVQCDNPECLKWRKLPLFVTTPDLPEKWYCLHHPDKKWRSCDVPEELEEGNEDSLQPYVKKQKKRLERELEENKRKEKEAKKVKELELEVKRNELQKREVELQRLMKSVEAKSKQQKEAMNKQQQKGNLKSEVASPQKLQIKVVGPASRQQPGTTTPRKYIVQQTNGQRVILTPVDKQSKPQSFVVVKTMPGSAIRPANIVTTATPLVQAPGTSSTPRTNQTGLQIVKIISHGTPKGVIPTASVSNTKMIRPMHPKVAGSPVILKVSNQAAADHFNSLPTMVPVSAIVDPKVVAVQSLAPLKAQPLVPTLAKTQPVKVNLMAQQTSASYRPLESLKEVNRQAAQNTVSPVSAVVPDKNVLTASSPTRRDVTVNDRFRYIVATGDKSSNSAQTSSNTPAPQVIVVQQVKTEQTPVVMTQVSGSQHLTVTKAETLQSTASTNVSPLKRSHNGSSTEATPYPKISKIDSDIIVIDPPSPPTIQSISPQSASTSTLVKIEPNNLNAMPSTNASTSGINESTSKADKIEHTKPELQIGTANHIPQIDQFIINKVKEMNPQQQLKALLSRTQQLHDLRANVCKLLRVLVPELEIDDQRESFEDQTVDELLKQVLQQAESS